MFRNALIISTLLVSTAAMAAPLSTDARITRELTAAAVADEIRNKCPRATANMFTAISKALSLKSHAKSLGADDAEIDAFLDSKTEQARIRGLRNAYMAKNGVVSGKSETYCALGRAEVKAGSLTGKLISVR